ncbi:MAG: biopolymer transporter ExbD [Planctomycetota bacterium]
MAKRKRPEDMPDGGMNMTPMIDVVFLLLIFFMCATKFKTLDYRIEANLPKDKGQIDDRQQPPQEMVEFRITILPLDAPENQPRAAIRIGRDTFVPVANLDAAVKAAYADVCNLAVNAGKPVPAVIDGDPEVDYEFVVMVINACSAAKVSSIEFAAKSKPM